MSATKAWIDTIEDISNFSGTEHEFAQALTNLIKGEKDFKNVLEEESFSTPTGILRPDITAERTINGNWKKLIIECVVPAPMTAQRLHATAQHLAMYKTNIPDTDVICAFPGALSKSGKEVFSSQNIEVWDAEEIASMIVIQERESGKLIDFGFKDSDQDVEASPRFQERCRL